MEEVHKKTQAEKAAELKTRLARLDEQETGADDLQQLQAGIIKQPQDAQQLQLQPPPGMPLRPMMGGPPGAPPGAPPPHLVMAARPPIMFRPAPPPLRPGMAPASVRLPPGPPPGRPPLAMPGQRMPPGPPPGMPGMPRLPGAGVVSAAPQINKGKAAESPSPSASTVPAGQSVIQAKPQMRNLKSDITRFVPTNVKIRREGAGKKKQSGECSPLPFFFL